MNMTFDNPLFLIPVMTGVIFIVAGWIMMKFPPKDINSLYGYRTKNSMKNKERWAFAQKYSADGSGIISSMVASGGLIELSEECDAVKQGDLVSFLSFKEVM